MKAFLSFIAVCAYLMAAMPATGQHIQRPDQLHLDQARAIVADSVFQRLSDKHADELAVWVIEQIHTDASGTTRTQLLSEFQSQFRLIVDDGPTNPFGELDGYDLLQEVALPGTKRYFRLLYMTYHQRTPLVWEFHFYVKPDGDLALTFLHFTGGNPFEYMSTSDMLIERFYSPY